MQHGDPYVKALVKHILNQVAEPVKIILSRWIYEGELDDAFNEVCIVPSVASEYEQLQTKNLCSSLETLMFMSRWLNLH